MNTIEWDYNGYKKLKSYKEGLPFEQSDWNATILAAFNQALPDTVGMKRYIYVSEGKLPILEVIVAYIVKEDGTRTMFNNIIRPLKIDNDKIYVSTEDDFDRVDINNCGIVKIINYE